jgi:hypothetical protein
MKTNSHLYIPGTGLLKTNFIDSYYINSKSPINIHTIHSDNNFGWQDEILKVPFIMVIGLCMIMARTGTGKGKIPSRCILLDSQKFNETIVYVPNDQKHLVEQHVKALFEFCSDRKFRLPKRLEKNESKQKYRIYIPVDGEKTKKYNYTVRCFENPSNAISSILLNKNCALYFDEIHMYQTSFGFRYAKGKNLHSKTNLESLSNAIEKEKNAGNCNFKNLIKIANENKVVFVSATLDDIIINEIGSYIGLIDKISAIVVRHREEEFHNIKINYHHNKDSFVLLIKDKYHLKEKSFIYCSSKKELEEIQICLLKIGINNNDIYSWQSDSRKEFDESKAKEKLIGMFINKATTGFDVKDLKNVFIARELSSSSSGRFKEDYKEHSFTNLAQQMMGRPRNDAEIHWLIKKASSTDGFSKTLFQFSEKGFDNVLKKETTLIHKIHEKLNENPIHNETKNFVIRSFILAYILREYYDNTNNTKKDSVLKTFKVKFADECESLHDKYECMYIKFIDSKLTYACFDNWIKEYCNLEIKMIEQYVACVRGYGNFDRILDVVSYSDSDSDDSDLDSNTYTNSNENKERRTGGGQSKINISAEEVKIGIGRFIWALVNSGHIKNGRSLFYRSLESELEYDDSYMHSYPKAYLSDLERTKSMYGIPMCAGPIDKGLNVVDNDLNNCILPFDEELGITVNYDLLVKKAGPVLKHILRTEEEINEILYLYNKYQKEGVNRSYDEYIEYMNLKAKLF